MTGEAKLKVMKESYKNNGGYNVFCGFSSKSLALLLFNNIPRAILTDLELVKLYDIDYLKKILSDNNINYLDYAVLLTLFHNNYLPLGDDFPSFDVIVESYRLLTKDSSPYLFDPEGKNLKWGNLYNLLSSLSPPTVDQKAYYDNLLNPKGTDKIIVSITGKSYHPVRTENDTIYLIQQYVDCMEWFIAYYNLLKVDWMKYYSFPKGPLLVDLIRYNRVAQSPLCDKGCSYHIVDQLMASIDPRMSHFLPSALIKLVSEYSPISDMYPQNFLVEGDQPILPKIDMERIKSATKNLNLPGSWEEFEMVTEWIFTYKNRLSTIFDKNPRGLIFFDETPQELIV